MNNNNNCCSSQSRCGQTQCAVCARRYAGRLAKRIQKAVTGKLFAIGTKLASPTLADFWAFRVEARNFIDYRRRACRWWRELMLQVWLCQDWWVRGVGSFGSLTEPEVLETFQARWPTTLRGIQPEMLRSEITAIIHPGSLTLARVSGRYQGLRFAIWPRRSGIRVISLPSPTRTEIEPMPILF
jgi:hypothetical protein